MEAIQSERKFKIVFKYLYIYLLALLVFVIWLLAFLKKTEVINFGFNIQEFAFVGLGAIALIVLIFIRDSFYLLPLLLYAPFGFASYVDANNIPIGIIISASLAIIGLIIHCIIYRTSFKLGSFFISILVLCVGIGIGGIGNKDNTWINIVICLSISLALMFAYMISVTYLKEHEFSDISHIMQALGLIIVLEVLAYQFITNPNAIFTKKDTNLGWGVTNNYAMILLMIIPFSMYLSIYQRKISLNQNPLRKRPFKYTSVLYLLIGALFSSMIALSYSRGAIIASMIIYPIAYVFAFLKSEDKRNYIIYSLIVLFICVSINLYLHFFEHQFEETYFSVLNQIDINTMNGREEIFSEVLNNWYDYPLFGRGLMMSLDESGNYMWAHNLFLHSLYTTGFFGFVLLVAHLFFKYFNLMRHPNIAKTFVFLGFSASGIYDLLDVGYYYINFMIVLIVILIGLEYEIGKSDNKFLTYEDIEVGYAQDWHN